MTTNNPHVGLDTSSFGFHWVSSVPLLGYLYGKDVTAGDLGPGEPCGYFKAKGDVYERWIHIFRAAYSFFCDLPHGTRVWCEEPLALPRNGKTTRILGISAGIIHGAFIAASEESDSTWFWVDVASWKRAVIGNGSANKELIRSVVRENPSWQELARIYRGEQIEGVRRVDAVLYDDIFEDQRDLYDAWALMKYGIGATEMKVVDS